MTCTCPHNHTAIGPSSIRLVDARCPVHGDPTGREVLDYVEHANGEITLEYIKNPADPALRSACERAADYNEKENTYA